MQKMWSKSVWCGQDLIHVHAGGVGAKQRIAGLEQTVAEAATEGLPSKGAEELRALERLMARDL